jgi:hypothetical protein
MAASYENCLSQGNTGAFDQGLIKKEDGRVEESSVEVVYFDLSCSVRHNSHQNHTT